jgi:hypothetical protein
MFSVINFRWFSLSTAVAHTLLHILGSPGSLLRTQMAGPRVQDSASEDPERRRRNNLHF